LSHREIHGTGLVNRVAMRVTRDCSPRKARRRGFGSGGRI
jgi:hypothetical protein